MNRKRIAFQTLGCKLNFAESSDLLRNLNNGFQHVEFDDVAEFYVVQSCVVTSAAEKKCRAAIRQAHKRNPQAKIVVMGCMSELRADVLSKIEGVSLILGNEDKFRLQEFINHNSNGFEEQLFSGSIMKNSSFHPAISGDDRTRVFVKIQDGCDYFCTFCTIPFARGRSRSYSIQKTMELISEALKNNPKELVITGVNIGDFGKPGNETLLDLLEEIEKIATDVRIRLSSVEPDLLSNEIIELVAGSQKFMPHFHIPLQSGSNTVLQRMKRHYRREVFSDRVEKIKSLLPGAFTAADVITGFPGETEEEFMETFSFINALPLSNLHVFSYSERPGTRAAKLDGKISPSIIQERTRILIELSEKKKIDFLLSNTGRTEQVLFETENAGGYISGFTRNYIRVKAPFSHELENRLAFTKLSKFDQNGVFQYEPLLYS